MLEPATAGSAAAACMAHCCCMHGSLLLAAPAGGCATLLLPDYCQQVFPRYVAQLQQLLAQQAQGDGGAPDSLAQLVTWRVSGALQLSDACCKSRQRCSAVHMYTRHVCHVQQCH